MDDRDDRNPEQVGMGGGRGPRLAAALRANLLRRKKQALERSRAAPGGGPAAAAGSDPTGSAAGEAPHDSAGFVAEKTVG